MDSNNYHGSETKHKNYHGSEILTFWYLCFVSLPWQFLMLDAKNYHGSEIKHRYQKVNISE
jgi:hypothetical protein